MAQYTLYLGSSTSIWEGGQSVITPLVDGNSQRITLGANEYVTGIAFANGDIYNNSESGQTAAFYLSDTAGTVWNLLGEKNFGGKRYLGNQSSDKNGNPIWVYNWFYTHYYGYEMNKSDVAWKNLKGKTLAVWKSGNGTGVRMDGWATVTITTAVDAYSITVGTATGGTAKASASSAAKGTEITMTATPNTGYKLNGWTVTPDTLSVSNNKFTMPDANVTITPKWVKIDYSITKKTSPEGAGTITAKSSANYNDQVAVSQTPATGYTFSKWTLSNGGTVASGKFTMPAANITITATYTANSYNITSDVSPKGAGSVTVKSKANYNDSVAVSQTPGTGYTFKGWKLSNGGTVSGGKFTMPAGNITVTAEYVKTDYTITPATSPQGAGTVTVKSKANYNDSVAVSQTPATGYTFKGWKLSNGGTVTGGKFTMPAGNITVTAEYVKTDYTITPATSPQNAGTVTVKSKANYNDTVPVTQTPAAGYTFKEWKLSNGGRVIDGKFTMPAANITVTAEYTVNGYQITAVVSPAGAGLITVQGAANYGSEVPVSQEAATGYYFNGWELSSGGKVENGKFTMPAQAVTITAKYLRRSTGTLNRTTLQGGEKATLAISSEDANYTHQYKISFGSGMETEWINVPARTSNVEIDIPKEWAEKITASKTKGGGTLSLRTYNGATLIGTYEIGNLTYSVPADAVPEMGEVNISVLRTVDGTAYADIGEIYTQNHSGVKVEVGQGTPKYGTSIASTQISIAGYSGGKYDKTYLNNGAVMESGVLNIPGETKISIRITDARGNTTTREETISVTRYAGPIITEFECWRVNAEGGPDNLGELGQYAYQYTWTNIGSNEVHAELSTQGNILRDGSQSGWLLPGNLMNYDRLQAHEITLTVKDKFETAKLTYTLGSGKYVLHFATDGRSVAIGHAVSHTAGDGYDGTFEIDGDLDIWIGNRTLKEYILAVNRGDI